MSKYIDAIRQEIERQLEYFKGKEEDTWDDCDNYTDEDAMWYQGHWKMCSRLLSFIDSLPEEACKDSLQAPETCKENADSFTAEEDGPFDEDEFLEDELSAFLQNYDKEYDDDAAVSDVARHFYEIGKKQNEQKSVPFSCGHENGEPAEWSEEDEKIAYTISNLLCSHVTYVPGQGTTSGRQYPTYAKEKDWFERRFKFLRPQHQQEWSDDVIRKAVKEVGLTQHQINWFETNVFPPKQEWNAEDKEMLEYVIGDVNDAKQLFTTKEAIDLYDKEIAWLKSLRPSWKPSEEQMEALLSKLPVVKGSGDKVQDILESLYNDLKKLM